MNRDVIKFLYTPSSYEEGKFSKSRGVGVFGDNTKDSNTPAHMFPLSPRWVEPLHCVCVCVLCCVCVCVCSVEYDVPIHSVL